jgi:hypothetical protein
MAGKARNGKTSLKAATGALTAAWETEQDLPRLLCKTAFNFGVHRHGQDSAANRFSAPVSGVSALRYSAIGSFANESAMRVEGRKAGEG